MQGISWFRSLLALGATCALTAARPAGAEESASASAAARSAIREIEQSATVVRIELRMARGSGDFIGARCASEKLSEVHAQLRLANQHAFAPDDRRHRFALETARERARELARAARRCRESDSRTRVIARSGGRSS
jgi:hypothetical protein